MVDFIVVKIPSVYNIIFGQPGLSPLSVGGDEQYC